MASRKYDIILETLNRVAKDITDKPGNYMSFLITAGRWGCWWRINHEKFFGRDRVFFIIHKFALRFSSGFRFSHSINASKRSFIKDLFVHSSHHCSNFLIISSGVVCSICVI